MSGGISAQQRAQLSAQAMWSSDAASKWLGITLDAVGPGTAQLSLTLQPHHLNGHEIGHGGFLFTLADSAFAFACNSYNQLCVGQHTTMSYLAPAKPGATITANATEVARQGRSGTYDVVLHDQDGTLLALFRGTSRQVPGQHFDESDGIANGLPG